MLLPSSWTPSRLKSHSGAGAGAGLEGGGGVVPPPPPPPPPPRASAAPGRARLAATSAAASVEIVKRRVEVIRTPVVAVYKERGPRQVSAQPLREQPSALPWSRRNPPMVLRRGFLSGEGHPQPPSGRVPGTGSRVPMMRPPGAVAEWLRSGLQSRLHQFDSGRRLCSRLDKPAQIP